MARARSQHRSVWTPADGRPESEVSYPTRVTIHLPHDRLLRERGGPRGPGTRPGGTGAPRPCAPESSVGVMSDRRRTACRLPVGRWLLLGEAFPVRRNQEGDEAAEHERKARPTQRNGDHTDDEYREATHQQQRPATESEATTRRMHPILPAGATSMRQHPRRDPLEQPPSLVAVLYVLKLSAHRLPHERLANSDTRCPVSSQSAKWRASLSLLNVSICGIPSSFHDTVHVPSGVRA